jgi:hypothetical protein
MPEPSCSGVPGQIAKAQGVDSDYGCGVGVAATLGGMIG